MPVQEVEAVGGASNASSQQLRYLELKFREKNAAETTGALAQSTVQSAKVAATVVQPALSSADEAPVTGYDAGSRLKSDLARMLGSLQSGDDARAPLAETERQAVEGEDGAARNTASGLARSLTSLLHFVHSGDVDSARKQAASLQDDLTSLLAKGEEEIKSSESADAAEESDSSIRYLLQKDLMAMMNAVRVGDLNGARAALETYENHEKALSQEGASVGSHFITALQNLLQAVQSGNASSARTAAQALFVSDLQSLLRAASSSGAENAENKEDEQAAGVPSAQDRQEGRHSVGVDPARKESLR